MSKHTAPVARRLLAVSLFALVGTSPVLAEVRLHPLAASFAAAPSAPIAVVVKQEIAIRDPRASDGILSCTRSGQRMVC